MKKPNHCVIFIPGFKGSLLCNQRDNLVWPNVLRTQFSNTTLNYNLPELGLLNPYQYHSTDIVKSVSIIPYIFELNIYGNFIDNFIRKFSHKTQLITFHYDWRDHLYTSISKLNDLILKLKAQGINKIDIICHSMGGLITSYLLRYGKDNLNQAEWSLAQYINKVLFVATPFKGTIRSLHDIMYGTRVGVNRSLLSPKSMCTFPSVYYLLPSYKDALIVNNKAESKECSLFDLNTWQQYKLGFLNRATTNPTIRTKRIAYLSNCLTSAKNFHNLLNMDSEIKPSSDVKIILITSESHDCISKVEINESSDRFNWHYDQGDGSISRCSTQPPNFFSFFQIQQYVINAEHSKMFLANDVQEICWQEISSSIQS